MPTLILLRHGESVWNKENKFTGWQDVNLSEEGINQSRQAAYFLKEKGFLFDLAFTSFLKRATHTLEIVLNELNLSDIPVKKTWRLNERRYGALETLNKKEIAEKYGDTQVHRWRRGYEDVPPPLTENDFRYLNNLPKMDDLKTTPPLTESLKNVELRLLPYWQNEIIPEIKSGKKIIIVAHGNSLRALIRYLDNLTPEEIEKIEIPVGISLIYKLNDDLKPVNHYYLN